MNTAWKLACVCAATLLGCQENRAQPFEEFAREANPLLLEVRPAADEVFRLASSGGNIRADVAACVAHEDAMLRLSDVSFDSRHAPRGLARKPFYDGANMIYWLSGVAWCGGTLDSDERARACHTACLHAWLMLQSEVHLVRLEAAAQDVDIVGIGMDATDQKRGR